MKILKKIGLNILMLVLYPISFLVRRDKCIWVFGAWRGNLYSDNTKYMYQYILQKQKKIRPIWVTKNKQLCEKMNSEGKECHMYYSCKGIFYSLRAAVFFMSEGNQDVNACCCGKAIKVQLFHGIPLKKIGADNPKWKKPLWMRCVHKVLPYKVANNTTNYYMVASKRVGEIFQSALGAKKDRIFITGQCRNDSFIQKQPNLAMQEIRERIQDKKLIIYLPTHRGFGKGSDYFSIDKLKLLDTELRKYGYYMLFKPHFHEMKKFLGLTDNFTNIFFAADTEIYGDVYELFEYTDMLITDYSSVFFDYICSGKPMVFFPFDYQEYLSGDAELYCEYDEVVPGRICRKWEDLCDTISAEFANPTKVPDLALTMNAYYDGQNCERVFEQVQKLLEENS